MLRWIAITIVFLCCTFIGYYLGEVYKRRYNQLNELYKGILLLNNEVMFSHTPLPDGLKNVSYKVYNPVKELFVGISNDLIEGQCESVYSSYQKNIDAASDSVVLDIEDKKILEHFFKNIGESLAYGQDKVFGLTLENLKINCKRAEKLSIQNTRMFRRMGICVGAMAAIFLI
ncbi:MAG: stage III sporulation protein AB [Clostridium sp.]